MNPTHVHLLLNHVPVLGTIFGLALVVFALWRASEELKKTALGIFVVAALFAVPVYLTGEPAEDIVERLAGVSKADIERHEDAAAVAFTGVLVLGIVALGGLLFFRRGKIVPSWFGSLMVVASLTVAGMMAWTANIGGQIRHSEIRSDSGRPATIGQADHR